MNHKISFTRINSRVWGVYQGDKKLGVVEQPSQAGRCHYAPVGAVVLNSDDLRAIAGFIDRPKGKNK